MIAVADPGEGTSVTDARLVLVGIVVGLAGCTTLQRIGPPRLPQLEQASEVVQGPGDRLSAHRTCSAASKTIDEMVVCMGQAGYGYIERSPGYPASECWMLRDDSRYGGGRMPETFCFVKTKP
jgi:hypothetical protein